MTMPPQHRVFGRETVVAFLQHRCVKNLQLSATATWVNGTPAVELRPRTANSTACSCSTSSTTRSPTSAPSASLRTT